MKDILIVVAPSRESTHPVYTELQTEIDKYDTEARQILYTTFLLSGPSSFERAKLLADIADRHGFQSALFEIEQVLQLPPAIQGPGGRFPVR
jgi:hypothetical protein